MPGIGYQALDHGQHVVRRGPAGHWDDKGRWFKPGKDKGQPGANLKVVSVEATVDGSEPQRFIPEKGWRGQRVGYYFAMGAQGRARHGTPISGQPSRAPRPQSQSQRCGSCGFVLRPTRNRHLVFEDTSVEPPRGLVHGRE